MGFDFAQDITDPNILIGTQVFADREAWMREERLPEVRQLVARLGGLVEMPPEMSAYEATQLSLSGGDA
jgi:quinol monooxygenase YgiN